MDIQTVIFTFASFICFFFFILVIHFLLRNPKRSICQQHQKEGKLAGIENLRTKASAQTRPHKQTLEESSDHSEPLNTYSSSKAEIFRTMLGLLIVTIVTGLGATIGHATGLLPIFAIAFGLQFLVFAVHAWPFRTEV
jgi:hypothetical protein